VPNAQSLPLRLDRPPLGVHVVIRRQSQSRFPNVLSRVKRQAKPFRNDSIGVPFCVQSPHLWIERPVIPQSPQAKAKGYPLQLCDR